MHTEWPRQNAAIFGAFRRTILRRHQDYCGAMRLFRQPALDAPAVFSSTSKLCHFGSPRVPRRRICGPDQAIGISQLDGARFAFCRGEITAPIAIAALTQ
jgi:hypothetical protein